MSWLQVKAQIHSLISATVSLVLGRPDSAPQSFSPVTQLD